MKSLTKYISGQFANPSGIGGRIITCIMNRQNRKQYQAVSDNIDIQPEDTILDIGFGNGYLIGKLLKHNPAKICGIEISQYMLNNVRRKYRQAVSMKKLDLRLADCKALPFDDACFDKICTVNTLYFWNDTDRGFAEIERTLKPSGIFLNVFYCKDFLDRIAHTRYGYSKYTVEQVTEMAEKSGLKVIRIIEIQPNMSYCMMAEKKGEPTVPKPLDEMSNEELWQLFPIIISEFQTRWKDDFMNEAELLKGKIGNEVIERISHIGSTAVPGLPAKPTIDILLEIKESAKLEKLVAAMESIGYIYSPQPDNPDPHMMFLKGYTLKGFDPPVYHVHIRYPGDWDEIYFRDYLIAHPEAAKEYGDIKLKLKEIFEHNRDGYTEAKTEFIMRIVKLARQQ